MKPIWRNPWENRHREAGTKPNFIGSVGRYDVWTSSSPAGISYYTVYNDSAKWYLFYDGDLRSFFMEPDGLYEFCLAHKNLHS